MMGDTGLRKRRKSMASKAKKAPAKVEPVVKPRRICVLGYAEETRDLVFQLDNTVEVWGINMAHHFTYATDSSGTKMRPRTKARPTVWFQIHPQDWANQKGEVTGYWGRPKEHFEFLKKFDGEIYMQDVHPEIKNSKRYPLEEISAAAGRRHFTSTFAYQLGLIWYQHKILKQPVETVYLYGINLTSIDEYIHQKSCVEYWCGRLEDAGVKVIIPSASALMKGKLYARSEDGTGADLSDHAFERLQVHKKQYMQAWANVNTTLAIKADVKFWAKRLSKFADDFPESFTDELKDGIQAVLDKRVNALDKMVEQATSQLNGEMGVMKSEQHWLAVTGGIDHKAAVMPELMLPSLAMSEDFNVPEVKSI